MFKTYKNLLILKKNFSLESFLSHWNFNLTNSLALLITLS